MLLPAFALGCGGASLVLKGPVEDSCKSSGLQGCPMIAEGVIQYVEGDKVAATTKVVRAAAANSPAQVKKFAEAVRMLKDLPGAGDYVAPMVEIADLLVADAEKTAALAKPTAN